MEKMERRIVVNLGEHIEQTKKTQKEFADMVGLRPATISQFVNNKYDRVELSHILKIMDAIGTEDFNDIFKIVEVKDPE